jgi:L-gulonolactone oxidase
VLSATLQLKRVRSAEVDRRDVRFANLKEFFALDREMAGQHEYAVAWVDCLATGAALGRGLYSIADHAQHGRLSGRRRSSGPRLPFDLPGFVINRFTVGLFNALKYRSARTHGNVHHDLIRYLYPLDAIRDWNRAYGRRGFYQHQCVISPSEAEPAIAEMLRVVAASGQGSPLAVLKNFGNLPSPGMLSFPREGTTLALDFPNRGEATLALLRRLDAIVIAAGGRLYPAKDELMTAQAFRLGYPRLDEFAQHVDEGMSSSFWRRVQG